MQKNFVFGEFRALHPVRAALRGVALASFFATALLAMAGPSTAADTFDIVSKQSDTAASTVWRIEAPNVKQKETDYPEVVFHPGDTVSIDAGGCVQTGGSGLTWKRYVNPSGPNSGHLYHGLVGIPGVTNGLVRIQDFGLNTVHQIPASVSPANFHLQLGYEDDGYGDNGYYKHDNGTGDQCKNIFDAFVIVSIGHGGAAPVSASSFEGITPDRFRCQAAWAFHNFNTASLSFSTFKNAFDLKWYDYIDPATYNVFLATRNNLASGGNCMGMSLLAEVGEDQFVVEDLNENFWTNYKRYTAQTPKVSTDINTAHWEQLSVAFLHSYLANVAKSPAENAALIERDLTKQDYNYGLLSIAHSLDGHVLVPLRVSHAGSQILIDVYDPNRQCGSVSDTAKYPPVVIDGSKWSFLMDDGSTWSGSTLNDGLAYVPYTSPSGWRAFAGNFTGIVEVLFGANTQIQQVTDARGRKLFLNGTQTLDSSAAGLGNSLFRLPSLHQNSAKRPRQSGPRYTTVNPVELPPSFAPAAAKLDAEYAADYSNPRNFFITSETSLADLSFQIRAADSSRPVRAMIHQGNQFFEVNLRTSQAAAGAMLLLHQPSALAAQGVILRSADGKPVSAAVTFGSNLQGIVHVERTAEIPLSGTLRARVVQSNLALSSAGPIAPTTITEQELSAAGEQLKPVRPLSIAREPYAKQ